MEIPREKLDLRDDQGVLSPPTLTQPLYGCAKSVNVTGYVPNATLDVELNGVVVVAGFPGNSPAPSGATIHLPNPLVSGQNIRARQHHGGATSGWSPMATVRDHTADYPAGPPRPEIFPTPLYRCGVRTGVGNLLVGCDVRITENGATVGAVAGANNPQGVNVNPAFDTGQHVRAWASLCNDPSPPSLDQIVQPPSLPLPVPGFDLIYDGGTQLVVNTIVDGAKFTLSRNGLLVGTFPCWGGKCDVGLNPPFHAGETFKATQELCPGDGPSPPGTGTVLPCSALPAPPVAPVQDGDTQIVITQFVPGSEIKVFVNSIKTGDGSGPVVKLTAPVPHGATIDVWQILGTCQGRTVQQLTSLCVAPPTTYDPAALDLFPVGSHEFDLGTVPVTGFGNVPIRGSVYYPAVDDGVDQPFNNRLLRLGPRPVIILIHGNHDPNVPSYHGYDYFQEQLARMGFIVFSLNHNHTNGDGGGATNIVLRAETAIASIAKFQQLNATDARLKGTMDFERLGLMGHSRGGEEVMVIPERIHLQGVTIRAVLALAPTANGASSGVPGNYTFMTILPAADGDVRGNQGARFYDQSAPHPLRSQVYVDFANHNYFNRQWGDDPEVITPHLHRADQEPILSAYGCALFRTALAGDDQSGFLRGLELPADVVTNNVHLAFDVDTHLVVDNFDGHPITVNSLGQPNTQSGGFVAQTFSFHQGAGAFNSSFFGNTSGMIGRSSEAAGIFRLQLAKTVNLEHHEVWLRAAEVWQGHQAQNAVDFRVGVEDTGGTVAWVDVNDVGGISRPFDRSTFDSLTKTMLSTLRFPGTCFAQQQPKLRLSDIHAILIALETLKEVPIAFDDIAVVPSA